MKRYQTILIKLKQIHDLNKLFLSFIIIYLKRDDFVASERFYQESMFIFFFVTFFN